jgi:hypothetical protein
LQILINNLIAAEKYLRESEEWWKKYLLCCGEIIIQSKKNINVRA